MNIKFGNEYHRLYWHERKKEAHRILGSKCVTCGSIDNLEIDHIDPKTKLLPISRALTLSSWKDELKKCQLLCQPCHVNKTNMERKPFRHGTKYSFMRIKCKCNLCIEAKNAFNDNRNSKRRILSFLR